MVAGAHCPFSDADFRERIAACRARFLLALRRAETSRSSPSGDSNNPTILEAGRSSRATYTADDVSDEPSNVPAVGDVDGNLSCASRRVWGFLGACKEEGQKRGMRERRGLKRNPAPLEKRPRVDLLVMGYVKCAGTESDEI